MSASTTYSELVFIICSLPDRQEWVLSHGTSELVFPDRNHGKIPGLVNAIRHAFFTADGQLSLLLIQHGGKQFRLRFHAEGLLEHGLVAVNDGPASDLAALSAFCGPS